MNIKKLITVIITIFAFIQVVNAQESFKKRYIVRDSVKYHQKYYNSVKKTYEKDTTYLVLQQSHGNIDSAVLKKARSKEGLKADVSFGEKDNLNRIWINPWLLKDSTGEYINRDSIYYFELQNRQSIKISFFQWSLNALTVPLKVRFGTNKRQYLTGANLGALIGYTWGKTNFLYRKTTGNKEYETKTTLGVFVGAEKLEFAYMNNNIEVKVNTASLSTGLGLFRSYQKFTFGGVVGFDFALGENRKNWDYHRSLWLGASLGYSLFAF